MSAEYHRSVPALRSTFGSSAALVLISPRGVLGTGDPAHVSLRVCLAVAMLLGRAPLNEAERVGRLAPKMPTPELLQRRVLHSQLPGAEVRRRMPCDESAECHLLQLLFNCYSH